jgi:hypothetical protein
LLDDGVFEDDVPGKFAGGYRVQPGEMERLLEAHGFAILERLSAESVSVGAEAEVGDLVAGGRPTADSLRRLILELAGHDQVVAAARHLLPVAGA